MITKAAQLVVTFLTASVGAFMRGFIGGLEKSLFPEDDEWGGATPPADLELAIQMAVAAHNSSSDKGRTIKPFASHMSKYFGTEGDFTRSEVVENMTLSLESVGKEIQSIVSGSTISSRVERTDGKSGIILHGHLDWKVDNHNPKVYAISMDLLKDGFIFRADTSTFVITGRIPE
jgi:hypothetical protein